VEVSIAKKKKEEEKEKKREEVGCSWEPIELKHFGSVSS